MSADTAAAGTSRATSADAVRAVLRAGQRPEPPSPLSAALVFGWRAMLKIKHVPEQLFDVTITPILFTLLFTYLFGGALEGSPKDYLQFLLPGVLVQTVLFTTVYSGVTLNGDVSKGVFDRFRSLPIWRAAPIVGALLGDALRYLLAAAVTFTVGFVLGYRPDGGAVGMVLAVALLLVFAFALAWAFSTLGLLLRSPNAVMNLGFGLLFPITFASNVFVRPETMPGWLESAVEANPISYLVTAMRGLMGGDAGAGDILATLAAAAVLTAVFAPLTMWLYARKQ